MGNTLENEVSYPTLCSNDEIVEDQGELQTIGPGHMTI